MLDETSYEVNLHNVIMTHGKGFILGANACELCGQKGGLKAKCCGEKNSGRECRQRGQKRGASHVHLTCARQAGFPVKDQLNTEEEVEFVVCCYQHSDAEHAFRAKIEDLIEVEKLRVGKTIDVQDSKNMSLSHVSRLLNAAITVMQYLGWAWRWAEWWVEYDQKWEPLLEPGQDESKMTKEQLKIVESTPESRCVDARRCRLAALGAALRNRSFDGEKDGPTVMLDRALRAVLRTKSLVGPLEDAEVEFCAQWLGIAYRSKSRLLGFGDDKIPVDETYKSCLHEEDKTPKFVLGGRRLPGCQPLPEGQVFESNVVEIDDFLKPERLDDGTLYSAYIAERRATTKPKKTPGHKKKRVASSSLDNSERTDRPQKVKLSEEMVPKKVSVMVQSPEVVSRSERSQKIKKASYSSRESVLATHMSPRKGSDGMSSMESIDLVNDAEVGEKRRRRSAPKNFTHEGVLDDDSAILDEDFSERRVGRRAGSEGTIDEKLSVLGHRNGSIGRRKSAPFAHSNGTLKVSSREDIGKNQMRIMTDHRQLESDDVPLSFLRKNKRKMPGAEESEKSGDLELEPELELDLSSPQKRGRHRGKVEASKILFNNRPS
jgi:hypothetical protein